MDWIKENFALINDHPLLLSALIVLSSIIIAKLADIILTRILSRAVRKTVSDLDDKILELFHKPIFYSLLFIGFSFAVKVAQLPSYIDYALVGVFKTITIFIWFIVLLNVFSLTVLWAAKQSSNPLLQHRTLPLFNNLGKIVIVTFGIYFILLSWDININGFLASAGVLGIVLGLAAQDTVSNLFAGIFLMADSPFKEGDYIF
jgi:Small-conductance mechanosensitive channel